MGGMDKNFKNWNFDMSIKKIIAGVDGDRSVGSNVRRSRSEDPHRRKLISNLDPHFVMWANLLGLSLLWLFLWFWRYWKSPNLLWGQTGARYPTYFAWLQFYFLFWHPYCLFNMLTMKPKKERENLLTPTKILALVHAQLGHSTHQAREFKFCWTC